MRSRIAGAGALVAVVTALAGLSAVTLALTTPRSEALAAPDALAPAISAQGQQYPVAADYCYIAAMIPHHAQALELSGIVLTAEGVGDRTRALAEFIVADQSAEISAMEAWDAAWTDAADRASASAAAHGAHGASTMTTTAPAAGCSDHAVHTQMSGMVEPGQLVELREMSGASAQTRFLELMIAHHVGALEMAETAVRTGTNAFVRSSAKHVLIEQEREIAAMEALLEAP